MLYLKFLFNRLVAFLGRSYIYFRSATPKGMKRLGNFLLAVSLVCFAFQADFLEYKDKVAGHHILPDGLIDAITRYFMLVAGLGKIATMFTIDRSKLTLRQKASLRKFSPPTKTL